MIVMHFKMIVVERLTRSVRCRDSVTLMNPIPAVPDIMQSPMMTTIGIRSNENTEPVDSWCSSELKNQWNALPATCNLRFVKVRTL